MDSRQARTECGVNLDRRTDDVVHEPHRLSLRSMTVTAHSQIVVALPFAFVPSAFRAFVSFVPSIIAVTSGTCVPLNVLTLTVAPIGDHINLPLLIRSEHRGAGLVEAFEDGRYRMSVRVRAADAD